MKILQNRHQHSLKNSAKFAYYQDAAELDPLVISEELAVGPDEGLSFINEEEREEVGLEELIKKGIDPKWVQRCKKMLDSDGGLISLLDEGAIMDKGKVVIPVPRGARGFSIKKLENRINDAKIRTSKLVSIALRDPEVSDFKGNPSKGLVNSISEVVFGALEIKEAISKGLVLNEAVLLQDVKRSIQCLGMSI